MGFGFGASDVYTATALASKVIVIVPQYRTTNFLVRAPFTLALHFGIATRDHAYVAFHPWMAGTSIVPFHTSHR